MKQIALSLLVIAASGAYVWDHQPDKAPVGDLIDTSPAAAPEDDALQPPVQSTAPADPAAAPAQSSPMIEQRRVRFEPPAAPSLTIDGSTAAAIGALVAEPPAIADFDVADQLHSSAAKSQPFEAPAAPVKQPRPGAAPQEISAAAKPVAYIPISKPKLKPHHRQAQARLIKTGTKSQVAAKPAGYADGTYTGPVTDAYYGLIQIQALVQGGRLTALRVLRYPSDRRTSIRINRQALPMLRDEAISAQSANVDIISGATLTSRAFIQSLRGALNQASS